MHQLFNFFNLLSSVKKHKDQQKELAAGTPALPSKQNQSEGGSQQLLSNKAGDKTIKKFNDPINGEVIPGQLYNYYSSVLYRVEERVKEVKELV